MQAMLFSDNLDEAAVLTVVLQRAGFEVRTISSPERVLTNLPERPADLILLAFNGNEAISEKQIEQLRSQTVVPMIVIGDLLSDDRQVSLLESGADLVFQRPYNVKYLIAQIRALMRRVAGLPFFSLPLLTQSDVVLDPSTRTVRVKEGNRKRLTQLEFRLLYTLMTHAGTVIPAERLVEHVWGYGGQGDRGLVRGLIQRLRSKVEPDSSKPRYILTEPGLGYSFNPHAE